MALGTRKRRMKGVLTMLPVKAPRSFRANSMTSLDKTHAPVGPSTSGLVRTANQPRALRMTGWGSDPLAPNCGPKRVSKLGCGLSVASSPICNHNLLYFLAVAYDSEKQLRGMCRMKKNQIANARKETGKVNQFGDRLAYRKRIKVTEWKWQCSECGQVMPLADNPPKRCSNRSGCGRMLYDLPESES